MRPILSKKLSLLALNWVTYDGTDKTLPGVSGSYIFKICVAGCDNCDDRQKIFFLQVVWILKDEGFADGFTPNVGDKWIEIPSKEQCNAFQELIHRYKTITDLICPRDLGPEICVRGEHQNCPSDDDRNKTYFECWNIYFKAQREPSVPLTNNNVREIFKCHQCGRCCIKLGGAAEASCRDEDWNRWKKEKRHDILSRIETIKIQGHVFARDMWFKLTKDGRRGEMVSRCPWIRKQGEKYICRIHNTKPGHCRNFIPSPELAKKIGCQGWNDD